jgi:hypothetical protein
MMSMCAQVCAYRRCSVIIRHVNQYQESASSINIMKKSKSSPDLSGSIKRIAVAPEVTLFSTNTCAEGYINCDDAPLLLTLHDQR